MSVIIRLQNLPWSANALDIRQYFRGLNIPEGGVHIVGGELGDAFIAFSTDEDARQAFNLNGGKIKEVQIKLMLSSRTEMQKVIETARNPLAAFMQRAAPAAIPAAVPAIIPDFITRNDKEKEKRDRRRSRSRSRDRRDRSRERDSRERDRRERRRRDRSRSRSRDRRERRRRDRSRSKERRTKDNDRPSKEKQSEEKSITSNILKQPSVIPNIQKDTNQAVVWTNNVPVVQTPSILNSLIPAQLQQTSLLLNYRNGLQNQTALNLSHVVNAWNLNNLANQPNTTRSFQDELKAVSNIMGVNNRNNNFENGTRSNFNSRSGRVSRFEPPYDKASLSTHPPSDKGPHPLDRLSGSNRPEVPERSSYDRSLRSDRYDRERDRERQIIKDCCIELQPFYGGYSEIRKFFNGLFIHNNGIKFLNDEFGKRTGVVYIRFASPTGKERAIERNGMMLRDFSIELNDLADEKFDNAVDRYQPFNSNENKPENVESNQFLQVPSDCSCLAIEDLPLFAKEQDMLKLFADYPLQQIILQNKQRHIIAYVKFSTPEDAQRAAKERATSCFENKPLKIRFCSDDEYNSASQGQDELIDLIDDDDDEPQPPLSIETDCVSLSGLPKKTTDRDISDFFSDVAIVPKKIHLISSNFGFTGQVYCEFITLQDAQTALQKNGLPLGSGIVKVKPILRSEMETNIGMAIPCEPPIKQILPNAPALPVRDIEPPPDNRQFEMDPEHINDEIPIDNEDFEMPTNDQNCEPLQDDQEIYEPPDEGENYEPLYNSNFKLPIEPPHDNIDFDSPHDGINFRLPNEPRNFESLDARDYVPPPSMRNYEQSHNVRNFDPSMIDNRNYEPHRGMRNYELTDEPRRGMRNYEPTVGSRNYEPGAGVRNFESVHGGRPYDQMPNIRQFEPTSNLRNFDLPAAPLSRSLPPPLMGGMGRQPPPSRRLLSTVNPSDMASPGCTLLMENVPYKAGLDEILNFFQGFNVPADNVLRRYNDNGTPSAEAKVIFNSKDEAYQALQECNLQEIRERTIYLSQC